MVTGPRQTLGVLPHGKQRSIALLGAVVTFIVLYALLLQFCEIYEDNLLNEQYTQVDMQLFSYGNTFTNHISQDIAHLEGVDTFVRANPTTTDLYYNFESFAFGLDSGAYSIRSIQLFPVNSDSYVYPKSDNVSFMGSSYDALVEHERPMIRTDVSKAVQTRQIAISGPYDLKQGNTVMVALKAVYLDDQFWGMAVIVLDMDTLMRDAGLYDVPETTSIALRSSSGQMLMGSNSTFQKSPRIYSIALPEGALELAAMPAGGWYAPIKDEVDIVEKGGFIIVFLLSLLVYFIIGSYSSLKSTVVERTISLNDSESRYQQLFDNSPDALFLVNRKGRILDANNVAHVLYGYSKKELLGMTIFDLFSPEALKGSVPYIHDILEYSVQFQSVNVSQDGTYFPVEVSSALIKGERTNPGVLIASRDITERKKAEEDLLRSEEMFSRVFNSVPDSIILTSPDEEIINVNDSFVKNTGYGKNDVVGKTSRDIFLWGDNDVWIKYVSILKSQGYVRNFEAEIVQKSGSHKHVLISGDKVTIAGDRFLLTVFRDITDLKNTEKALFKTESLLNEVSQIARIGGWEFNALTGEGTWTTGVARIYDLDPEVKTGRDFGLDFNLPESKEKMEKAIHKAIETLEPYDVEAQLISAKGTHKWVRSLGRPVVTDGKVTKLTGSLQDITDLKKAEEEVRKLNAELEQRVIQRTSELEAANKELEAFTYSVSHDLRAPLRAIDGFTRIITEEYEHVFDDEARRLFGVIRSNTKKMDKLITDLLSLSRIGRNEINYIDIDMTAMVKSIFIDLVAYKEKKNFVFDVPDLPDVCADPTLIRQLWTNLLSNAVKYSMKNDEIRIEVGSYVENGMNVYFVKDNGVGFDPKYSDKLFGIFQRLHNDSEFEGTGVGLAIVQRIVARHGGRIWAQGKINEGATFYFSLPVKEENHECGQ